MNKKIVLAGTGPSLGHINYKRLPEDVEFFRVNNFYFEDKYYLGKHVDYYFTAAPYLSNQYFNLYHLVKKKEYTINNYYSYSMFGLPCLPKYYEPFIDIDTFIKNKEIAFFRNYYDVYFNQRVSGGILQLFTLYALGYKQIYMVGFDFYSNNVLYPWENDKNPVYEMYCPRSSAEMVLSDAAKVHDIEMQVEAIKLVKSLGVEIYSICDNTKLNEFVDLAPELETGWAKDLFQTKNVDSMRDWLELPEDLPSKPMGLSANFRHLNVNIGKIAESVSGADSKLEQIHSSVSRKNWFRRRIQKIKNFFRVK